jgi:hypothetical protein
MANAPPWQPPFGNVGEPGWLDSKGPFCGGLQDTVSLDVWSDATGVYVGLTGNGFGAPDGVPDDDAGVAIPSVSSSTPSLPGFAGSFGEPVMGGMGDFVSRTRVWHNDGTGWALRVDGQGASLFFGMTGVGQHIVLYTNPLPEELSCRLGMTMRDGFLCLDVDPVQDVIAVNRSLAYALMGGTRLLQFDGTAWHSHPSLLPYPATRLWADDQQIVAAGNAGAILRFKDGAWQLEDPGVLETLTAIWGASGDDLWVGTSTGKLLHYDGAAWSKIAELGGKTCGTRPAITGIWGSGGVVYVHTPTELDRWQDGKLVSLGNWTCGLGNTQQVRGMWGQNENDLFFVLLDQSVGSPCGSAFVAHYDGKQFHRM